MNFERNKEQKIKLKILSCLKCQEIFYDIKCLSSQNMLASPSCKPGNVVAIPPYCSMP